MLRPIESPRGWGQSSVEVVTVGLPFCAFKLLTGLIALGTPLAPLGYLLLAVGAVDLGLNLANLASLLVLRRRVSPVCVTDVALTRLPVAGDRELALAFDMFVSFSLVAVVIGFGLLLRLPPWALALWNVAVILNVVGAGVGRLWSAARRGGGA